MAGSISLSLSQQFDSLGRPLSGGLLYSYAAGTITPQSAYQDTGLSVALPNPITLDSAGRVPQLFFADGNIKVRITDANGVVQLAADNILVIGQSSGGGGGATVDPTTILQTGWIQPIYGTGNVTGFVRANGRTIGNSSSGASERANADTASLFAFLYAADTTLVVAPSGRGASAAADYAANKTIALPDARGRVLAGLNDMGNSNAGIVSPLPAAIQKGDTITLGSLIGLGTPHTLLTANLPAYTPSGSIAVTNTLTTAATTAGFPTVGSGAPTTTGWAAGAGTQLISGSVTAAFTGTAQGGTSTSFDVNPAMMLITMYIKL